MSGLPRVACVFIFAELRQAGGVLERIEDDGPDGSGQDARL